jgi:hypothetical protein
MKLLKSRVLLPNFYHDGSRRAETLDTSDALDGRTAGQIPSARRRKDRGGWRDWLEGLVPARAWGFKFPLRHHPDLRRCWPAVTSGLSPSGRSTVRATDSTVVDRAAWCGAAVDCWRAAKKSSWPAAARRGARELCVAYVRGRLRTSAASSIASWSSVRTATSSTVSPSTVQMP